MADATSIGHTNMPDMTIGGFTTSQLYGETTNPWGALRTPSGTSGGNGAAVAAGLAALGLVTIDPPADRPADMELDAQQNAAVAVSVRLCSVTSFAGLPAVAVPTGTRRGVPTGVQIIGRPFREDLCLSAAAAIAATVGVLTPVAWSA